MSKNLNYKGFQRVANHFNTQATRAGNIPMLEALHYCTVFEAPYLDIFYSLKPEYSVHGNIEAVVQFSTLLKVFETNNALKQEKVEGIHRIDSNFIKELVYNVPFRGSVFAKYKGEQLFNAAFSTRTGKLTEDAELCRSRNEKFYKKHGKKIENTIFAGQDATKAVDLVLSLYTGKEIPIEATNAAFC